MPPPASAGLTAVDASSDPRKAAQAYSAYLAEHALGMVDPIYSTIAALPVKCDLNAKPQVHAILIGAPDAGPPFNELDGPENDINLISSSLASRGVADYNIIPLVAADTGRQMVADVFLETLEAINCGDHDLLHFNGNASRAVDLLNSVLLRELLDQYSDVAISEIWSADLYTLGDRPTAAMRWVQRADLHGDMAFVRKTN